MSYSISKWLTHCDKLFSSLLVVVKCKVFCHLWLACTEVYADNVSDGNKIEGIIAMEGVEIPGMLLQ